MGVLQLESCCSEDSNTPPTPVWVGCPHWIHVSILGFSMVVHLGKHPFPQRCQQPAPGPTLALPVAGFSVGLCIPISLQEP